MIAKNIIVNEDITLIIPNPKRDAQVSVLWLKGEHGRENMRLMGCLVPDGFEPSLKTETKRLKLMVKSKNELIRMISYKGSIIGALEIWRVQYDNVPAPSISILIGNPAMRGLRLGSKILATVEKLLSDIGAEIAYTRTLLSNVGSTDFFERNGFVKNGTPYPDESGLIWQNYQKKLNT